jgi:uncharacterized protein (DUF427 family)
VAEPWKVELPAPRVEPSPRWVRARAGDVWVADSRRVLLLAWYGPGMLPTYLFPAEDVRTDLLAPSPGGARGMVVDHDLGLADRALERAAQLFRHPPAALAAADGHWSFTWDGRVTWFEEALEVHVHARDPSKRVDVLPSERHVRVELAGHLLADSHRPHALFETSLPTRWYLPVDDVHWDVLEPSDTVTRCPYKGTARYWSACIGDELFPDVAWSYPDPVVECPRIGGLICFFNERADLVVDGVPQPRPISPWSVTATEP